MRHVIAAGVLGVSAIVAISAQQPSKLATPQPADTVAAEAQPRYTAAGELIRPTDFREWTFVTSGLGMTYNQPSSAPRPSASGATTGH